MAHYNHGCVRVAVPCSAYRMPQSRPALCYPEGEPTLHRYRPLSPTMPTSRIPFLLATLLLAPSAIAQSYSGFNPQGQVLTGPPGSPTSADSALSVYATDLDGDGDADVLSASYGDDKIAWYENQGRFPTLLGSYTGSAPGDWNFETLPLPTLMPASGNVQFQFVYTRGSGYLGDLAIDNFCIY